MPDTADAAQRQIDSRALEMAAAALQKVEGVEDNSRLRDESHEEKDVLRFAIASAQTESVAKELAALGERLNKGLGDVLGAINTLRSEESGKRKAIYDNWDRYRDRFIGALIVLLLAVAGYAFHLATGK